MAEPIKTKRCCHCKDFKSLSEFHKNRTTIDGYRADCKVCRSKYPMSEKRKATKKQYRQTEKGKVLHRKHADRYRKTKKGKDVHRKANFRYKKTEKGKACNKRYEQSIKGKIVGIKNARKMRILYPQKMKARSAVNRAITAGQIPPVNTLQCNYCPKQAEQYHHHKGYAPEHWFNIVPACRKCHTKIHKKSA